MIATWHSTVIDCPDPAALADFYQELLGLDRLDTSDDWVTIGDAPDRPRIAFQRVEGYRQPEWPGQIVPQQMHLDVQVKDLDEGERAVLALGARDANSKHDGFRVYLDPAGHPFCLVL
ncbi:VOC family protein [Okibacterium endophyticum]